MGAVQVNFYFVKSLKTFSSSLYQTWHRIETLNQEDLTDDCKTKVEIEIQILPFTSRFLSREETTLEFRHWKHSNLILGETPALRPNSLTQLK